MLGLILITLVFSFNLISDNINLMKNQDFTLSYPSNCAGGMYGIGSDYLQKIKAYVFQNECPLFNDDNDNPMPEEKRELQDNDIIYKDEQCLAIVLEKFPCYCSEMGVEDWVFEYEEADCTVTSEQITHDPSLPYPYNGWIVFGIYWKYGLPNPCFLADLWQGIKFYKTSYIHCLQNNQKYGFWKLRFKYCSNLAGGCITLREWNVEFKNIDRGRIKLTLPDNPESILPGGLEIEPNTSAGGDTTRLRVYFETCDGPRQGQSISFRQKFINDTGGHNHSDPPECGSTSSHPTCGNITPQTVTTDKGGNATATYNAPVYSGGSYIKAQTNYNGYERESKEKIYHLIEGLQPITSRFGFVVLPDNQNCVHGNINNYLTPEMGQAVYDFIDEFIYGGWRPNTAPVYMTAGSLVAGGKFDDGVCWSGHNSGNHLYHREGKDADLDYSYILDGVEMGIFLLRSCLGWAGPRLGLREYGSHTDHIHIRTKR